jgi:geranylgeranyl reductase family protein
MGIIIVLKTMETDYDVIIVGAGIAGSATGSSIAEQGNRVLILEEHREVGRPVQCAGLVTPRIFQFIPENGCILNKVSGARIYSPNGNILEIDAGETKALVIDRVKFDQGLLESAIHKGCEVWLGAKAITAKRNNGLVEVAVLKNGEEFKIKSKLLIGADGVQSKIAYWFGLKGPKFILSGFGAEMSGVDIDPKFVEIYLGNNVAPNFFSWVVPKAEKRHNGYTPARVGLACTKSKKNAYQYYTQLFSHPILGKKLSSSKIVQYIAGGVPIGMVPKSYSDNLLLVGDSAGQIKPTSGGGIYTSMVCAKHCANTANLALENNDFGSKVLRSYHKAWQDEIGKELKHGFRLNKVYMHLTDAQLEDGFKLLGEKNILDLISHEGDIDYPSKLTTKLFKKIPQLLKFAKPYIRSFFD